MERISVNDFFRWSWMTQKRFEWLRETHFVKIDRPFRLTNVCATAKICKSIPKGSYVIPHTKLFQGLKYPEANVFTVEVWRSKSSFVIIYSTIFPFKCFLDEVTRDLTRGIFKTVPKIFLHNRNTKRCIRQITTMNAESIKLKLKNDGLYKYGEALDEVKHVRKDLTNFTFDRFDAIMVNLAGDEANKTFICPSVE